MTALSASGETAWQSLRQHIEWTPGFWLAFIFTNHAPSGRELFDRAAAQLGGLGRTAVVRRPKRPAEVTELLAWLLSGADAADGCVAIEWIGSTEEWLAAYRSFLLRLNEHRELLRRSVRGGVLLSAPTSFKSVTRSEAPDLWSIRSLVLDVDPPSRAPLAASAVERSPRALSPAQSDPHELLLAEQAIAAAARAHDDQEEAEARVRRAYALLEAGHILETRDEAARAVDLASTPRTKVRALEVLAAIDAKRGDSVAAERHLLAALEVEPVRMTTNSILLLAMLLHKRGALGEGLRHLRDALAVHRSLHGENPTPEALRDEAMLIRSIGDNLYDFGDFRQALVFYEESLAIVRRLSRLTGETQQTLRDEFIGLERVARTLYRQGDLSTAAARYQECVALCRQLLDMNENSPEALENLSLALGQLGNVMSDQGNIEDARAYYVERLAALRRVRKIVGDEPDLLRREAQSFISLGNSHFRQGDFIAARGYYDQGLVQLRQIRAAVLDTPELLRDESVALRNIGCFLYTQRNFTDAVSRLRESLDLIRRVRNMVGGSPDALADEIDALQALGEALFAQRDLSSALACFREALEIVHRIRAMTGESSRASEEEAYLLRQVGSIESEQGDLAAASHTPGGSSNLTGAGTTDSARVMGDTNEAPQGSETGCAS